MKRIPVWHHLICIVINKDKNQGNQFNSIRRVMRMRILSPFIRVRISRDLLMSQNSTWRKVLCNRRRY